MNKTADTLLGFVLGFILLAFVGGCVGYLYQTGFLEVAFKSATSMGEPGHRVHSRHSEKVTEPITKEEYKRRTRLGWLIGASVGAGIYVVFFLKLRAEEAKRPKGD